jgi:hypothetical protein
MLQPINPSVQKPWFSSTSVLIRNLDTKTLQRIKIKTLESSLVMSVMFSREKHP